jgi:hypothetical protein
MLKTIASAAAFAFVLAQVSILSSKPSAALTISKCTRSAEGLIVCTPVCPAGGQSGNAVPVPPPGTLASLLAEGYEIDGIDSPGGGNIILRKKIELHTHIHLRSRRARLAYR